MSRTRPPRWLTWLGVAGLVGFGLVLGTRTDNRASSEDRTVSIAAELRCPVCQGLSVADSNSQTARDIRADISQRIADGHTDAEIRQAYVDRYGEWILLRPQARGFGTLVWGLPVAATAAAAAALAIAARRWRHHWRRPARERDRRLVEEALGVPEHSDE